MGCERCGGQTGYRDGFELSNGTLLCRACYQEWAVWCWIKIRMRSWLIKAESVQTPKQRMQEEWTRLRRVERAARAYMESDPPRPEWKALAEALGIEWRQQ